MLFLFDLDGTLLNTLDDLHDAVNYALGAHSYPLRTLAQTRKAVGNGVRNLMIRSLPKGEETPDFDAVLETFRAYYASHSLVKTAPYDGVFALLSNLKAKGHRIGVVSNKFDAATKSICAHFFPNLIDVAIGEAEEKGIRKKPCPDSVFEAIRVLGGRKEDTVYIGDSEVDIETAQNAAVPCITVTWGFRDEAELASAGATCFVHSLPELAERLAALSR